MTDENKEFLGFLGSNLEFACYEPTAWFFCPNCASNIYISGSKTDNLVLCDNCGYVIQLTLHMTPSVVEKIVPKKQIVQLRLKQLSEKFNRHPHCTCISCELSRKNDENWNSSEPDCRRNLYWEKTIDKFLKVHPDGILEWPYDHIHFVQKCDQFASYCCMPHCDNCHKKLMHNSFYYVLGEDTKICSECFDSVEQKDMYEGVER